jgi:hypothetical protein
MKVHELEDLLARLPWDMLVHVESRGRVGAYPVTPADKQPRKRAEKVTYIDGEPCPEAWRGQPSVLIPGDGSYVSPHALVLRAWGPAWFLDEPAFDLRGRWPATKQEKP